MLPVIWIANYKYFIISNIWFYLYSQVKLLADFRHYQATRNMILICKVIAQGVYLERLRLAPQEIVQINRQETHHTALCLVLHGIHHPVAKLERTPWLVLWWATTIQIVRKDFLEKSLSVDYRQTLTKASTKYLTELLFNFFLSDIYMYIYNATSFDFQ